LFPRRCLAATHRPQQGDARNPELLNFPGNPVLAQGPVFVGATGAGVVLTTAGQLVGFDNQALLRHEVGRFRRRVPCSAASR